MTYGKAAKLRKNAFVRKGYVFAGWAKTKGGAVAFANAASVKNLSADGKNIALYAVWAKPSYKIAFYANGGSGSMAAQKMTYGKAAKLRKNAFVRKGYVFAGWATKKNGAVAYKNAAEVKNLRIDGKTVKLYAVWAKATYKVAFYANGGTGEMPIQKIAYGKATALAKNRFTAPDGKKFAGWATSKANAKAGKVKYKNKAAVKNLLATGKTVKLYAVWK